MNQIIKNISANMDVTISNLLDANDLVDFQKLYIEHVVNNYPFSSSITAQQYIDNHLIGEDPNGLFTKRRVIWKCSIKDNVLGFCLATEKRGGSVKFGPTIIKPELRKKGWGTKFRLGLEEKYRNSGFRKSYCTVGLNNSDTISYLLKIGYRIEVHFKDHFRMGYDELVLGKYLNKNHSPIQTTYEHPFSQINDLPFKRKFFNVVSNYCTEYDHHMFETFSHSISDEMSKDEIIFSKKRRKIFFTKESDNFLVAIPKRGHCVKLFPFMNTNETIQYNDLLFQAMNFFTQLDFHKFYVLLENNETLINYYRNLDFTIEGFISEPYKSNGDLLALSLFT